MNAEDLQVGDVFEAQYDADGDDFPETYLILDVKDGASIVEIRFLYISGPDAGTTFRTMLRRGDDLGDKRILP